jgi:hypothetical protein
MVTTTDLLFLYFWLYVHFDCWKVDDSLGYLKKYSLSTFNYRTNDSFAFEVGINRGKTFMGYVNTIEPSIQSPYDFTYLCPLDAYF